MLSKMGFQMEILIKLLPRSNYYDLNKFSHVIIYVGGNDASNGTDIEYFEEVYDQTIQFIKETNNQCQIKNAQTDCMEPFGLTQFLSEATRVTDDARTLIDHIYSKRPENVNSFNILNIGLSDHFPIF